MTYTAKFHPQAWQNDYAISVDPEGVTTWDVSAFLLALPKATRMAAMKADTNESDALRYAPTAPQWIQDWSGPFWIEVLATTKGEA